MIEFSCKSIFTNDFCQEYHELIHAKIKPFELIFSSEKVNFTEDVLSYLLINPFDSALRGRQDVFFEKYYNVMQFLLHSNAYYEFLRKVWVSEELPSNIYREKLREERRRVIEKYIKPYLPQLSEMPIDDACRTAVNYKKMYDDVDSYCNDLSAVISKHISYKKIDDQIRSFVIRNINVRICPYCNRNYCDFYHLDKKQKNVAALDHFYPQKKFPLYAVSLHNFVPSCYYCNSMIKKDRLYPLKSVYVTDAVEKTYFKIVPTSLAGLLGEKDDFLVCTSKASLQDRLKCYVFRHESIYKNHKQEIKLWLKRKTLHNDGYRSHLSTILKKNISEDELKMMLFDTTGKTDDFKTKPLSRAKKDILDL